MENVQPVDPVFERQFKAHKGPINGVDFGPSLQQLATGSDDKSVIMWHYQSDKRAFKYVGHKDSVFSVCFSVCGQLIASGSRDKSIRLWVPNNKGESEVLLGGHSAGVRCVHFSSDTQYLVSSSNDKTVKLWNIEKKRILFSLPVHNNWVSSSKFSPDDNFVATGCNDRTVKVFSVKTKDCIFNPPEMVGAVNTIAFHPTGTALAAGDRSGMIKLWDLRMKKLLQLYKVHESDVKSLAFHPSGSFILSGGADKTTRILNLADGRLSYTLHDTFVMNAVCFSSSGEYFATGSTDACVNVWKTNFDTVDYSICENKKSLKELHNLPIINSIPNKWSSPIKQIPLNNCKPENAIKVEKRHSSSSSSTSDNENKDPEMKEKGDASILITKHHYDYLNTKISYLINEVESLKQRVAQLEASNGPATDILK